MVEITNTSLALLVFATLVVVVGGSVMLLNQESPSLTGRATSDTGNVNLTIQSALNIQVDPGNETIDFGTCTPRSGVDYHCATNDALECDGAVNSNCTGDTTTPQFIRVENIGNVNASVNVTSNCGANLLIGGTSPLLEFQTTQCNGTNTTSWTTLSATTQLACSNIVPTTGTFQFYINVTIPQDATGGSGACAAGVATLTFSGTPAS